MASKTSEQSTTFRPFMRQFVVLPEIARRAGDDDVIRRIRTAPRKWNDVIDVIFLADFPMAVVAAGMLAMYLFKNVAFGNDATSSALVSTFARDLRMPIVITFIAATLIKSRSLAMRFTPLGSPAFVSGRIFQIMFMLACLSSLWIVALPFSSTLLFHFGMVYVVLLKIRRYLVHIRFSVAFSSHSFARLTIGGQAIFALFVAEKIFSRSGKLLSTSRATAEWWYNRVTHGGYLALCQTRSAPGTAGISVASYCTINSAVAL